MNLPYRHDLMLRVTVVNDGPTGEHGYITTAARLATLIGGLDEHVVGVQALPTDVDYRGRTSPSGGTFTVTQDGKTTAPISGTASWSEMKQACDDADVPFPFGGVRSPDER